MYIKTIVKGYGDTFISVLQVQVFFQTSQHRHGYFSEFDTTVVYKALAFCNNHCYLNDNFLSV